MGGGYCLPRLCVIGLSSSFLCAWIFVEGLCSLRELCGQGDGAEAEEKPVSLFGALIGKRRGREDIQGEKKGIAQ